MGRIKQVPKTPITIRLAKPILNSIGEIGEIIGDSDRGRIITLCISTTKTILKETQDGSRICIEKTNGTKEYVKFAQLTSDLLALVE